MHYRNWFTDPLYLVVLVSTGILALMSSGMVIAGIESLNIYLFQSFRGICHQQLWRTFTYNELYMAVCSRCFGFYSGLAIVTLFIPIFKKIFVTTLQKSLYILYASLSLNGIDFLGNFVGAWTNTLASRFILGMMLSGSIIIVIFSIYKPK